jgi:glycogen(starch) synthase
MLRYSEEEDPDEYPFPLTLRTKRSTGPTSPVNETVTNGGAS